MTIELDRLKLPFGESDIEWRIQSAGYGRGYGGGIWARVLAYVTARAIQDRLDEVCGPANWRNEFKAGPGGGVLCGIGIRLGEEWVTKWDGAENTQIESIKGGLSGAEKRAAVQWGIGRYLYRLEEGWAEIGEDPKRFKHSGSFEHDRKKVWFRWNPPLLPRWALPEGEKPNTKQERRQPVEEIDHDEVAATSQLIDEAKSIERLKEIAQLMQEDTACNAATKEAIREKWKARRNVLSTATSSPPST